MHIGRDAGSDPRSTPSSWLRHAPALALGSVLVWLVLLPLVLVVVSSFRPGGFPLDPGFTLANYSTAYGDPAFPALLRTTVAFALGAASIALVLGMMLAWLIERTDLPGRNVLRGLVLVPMATPPILLAVAWAMLASPRNGVLNQALVGLLGLSAMPIDIYSLPGMMFVQGLAMVPTAYLIMAPAFASMDPSLEEAGTVAGAGTLQLVARVMMPILWPQILSAIIFLVIVSLVVLDVPAALGTPARIFVLSTQIYHLVSSSPTGMPQYGQVSALAMLFLVALLALAWAYYKLTQHAHRYRTVTGKGFRPRIFPLGRGRPWAMAAIAIYFLLSVVAPLLILAWMSVMPYQTGVSWSALKLFTLENHLDFMANARVLKAATNSLIVAIIAATGVTVLALLVSWLTVRLKVAGARTLDTLAFVPIAVPGVMIAVALTYVYIAFSFVLPLYGTIWIIALAYLTQYLPFGTRTMGGMMLQLHPDLEEAGAMAGADRLKVLAHVTLPLVWPAMAAVWIWVLAHALRELSTALLLQGRDNVVIPTLLWDTWSGGEPNRTAAGGLWLTLLLIVMLVGWNALSRRAGLERPQ